MVIISVKKSPQNQAECLITRTLILYIIFHTFHSRHTITPDLLLRTTSATHYTRKIICCTEVK